MKKYIFTLLAAIAIAASLAAKVDSKAGEYGFQMLKISPSAAASATAGNTLINTNDPWSFLLNPAAGLANRINGVGAGQHQWLFETPLNSAAVSRSFETYSVGAAFRNLDYETQQGRDESMNLMGEFDPSDVVVTFNAAFMLHPEHVLGINTSVLYEKLDSSSALGVAVDLGYVWFTPVKGLRFAAAAKNLGGTNKMDKEEIELPWGMETSLAHSYDITPQLNLGSELRAYKYCDDDNAKLALGAALNWNKLLTLRLGYKDNDDALDISTGLGITWKNIGLDYSYAPGKDDLDDTHNIGLSYHF